MPTAPPPTVTMEELRIGLFVHLDLNWMQHPFPFSSFKIATQQQIDVIRGLGLTHVRYSPDKSDSPPAPAPIPATATPTAAVPPTPTDPRAAIERERLRLQQCERLFNAATQSYRQLHRDLAQRPDAARQTSEVLVDSLVDQLQEQGESTIRLLSDGVGDRATLHSVNVTVLCLLLGRAMGWSDSALQTLGLAALLHDMGKSILPAPVRYRTEQFTPAQTKLYQEHVAHGVAQGQRMGLPAPVLLAISQHHERADGSGFPLGCQVDQIHPAARILALINRYDNLCNPGNPVHALTPHEALARLFAQSQAQCDGTTLKAFIRMIGVYPPGSAVQLSDQRYAMVVSVNAARPLKPTVLIYTPGTPPEAPLDLEHATGLSILRGVRPLQLPRAALEFLSPRQRMCYFFERAVDADPNSSDLL